ncbi:cytochrome c [Vibrio sp. MACH09]|uniref:c-type cytochrome n=1 Tax=unclassified Vibrio TaxID=2614977 RepID=UPI0014934968|nr:MULTISPECIES: cytochrome c5 family protein [unclassified Vibrio]NOI68753.1 cytochrome c5 family protein [Vibrio sp. 99-8-1]GLO62352.1 cytochrome c [Vibrio sp. MACH09]
MSSRILGVLIATLTFSAYSLASSVSEKEYNDIAERIKPVGDVYLVGAEPVVEKPKGPRTAESTYGTYCVACHGTGVSGAPIKGNAEQWAPRIAQGMDVMTDHAIKGFNAMPAKGTCMDCSDDEIVAVINHMIEGL